MKWQNKCHEFDELGKVFQKNKELLFLGNIEKAKKMKKCLSFLGAKIFIPKIEYNNRLFDTNNIKKHIESSGTDIENKTIIIFDNFINIKKYLLKQKLIENINFFVIKRFYNTYFSDDGEIFTIKYLSIFAIYAYNKVYLHSNNIVTTTVCNLNCKACLNFNPYIKNKHHNSFENLKDDIDIYFKNVDMVGLMHITGGEPSLYPDIIKLLKYINHNYRDKIIDLVMPTNGIREISDELCHTFKECNMIIQVDNYLDMVPKYSDIYNNNIEKLIKYDVKMDIIPAGQKWNWVEAYPPTYDYSVLSDEENTKRFDYCGSIYSEIRDKKIYACCYHGFAETAGIVDKSLEANSDYFELVNNVNKKELIEFRLKYNERGYSNFCKYCNGIYPLNTCFVKAAEQINGIIEWDKKIIDNKYIKIDELIKKRNNLKKIAWFIPIAKFRNAFKKRNNLI